MRAFARFACIDWSGAQGDRLAGLALAMCEAGEGAPQLVLPADGGRWSRAAILQWLLDHAADDLLVGIDFSAAFPFTDCGAYFPGLPDAPVTARALWHDVERICATEPHLAARRYATERADHFRIGTLTGSHFAETPGNGRLRTVERPAASGRPISSFNLVGPAQVGLTSLSGMRLLAALDGHVAIWPFDPIPEAGAVLVEIYTSIAARAALPGRRGTKLRTIEELNEALSAFDSAPIPGTGPIDDHASDALLTAAWLRRAANRPDFWQPKGMDAVRQTEGWTFGVP